MARITINDFTKALNIDHSYDIMNAIRNSASPQFQQYIDLANAENVTQIGAGLLASQTLQNEFITSLVDRIGLFVLHQKTLKNILAPFKKGMLENGAKIEEAYIDLVKAKMYDPDEAESTVFKREIPDVKTLFHEVNRKDFYKQTIQDSSLRQAFISWNNFNDFVSGIINALYNSNQVDEFKYMKLLIDNYFAAGHFKVSQFPYTTGTEAELKGFLKKARATFTKLTLPTGSRDFNAMGVHTASSPQDLVFIVDADFMADVDVDVLASAFNLNKADFIGRVITIDNFASTGLRAVAIDESFFMVYDQVFKMETIRNPQGMYWNYFLSVWQVMSASRFANAVAFVEQGKSDLPDVYDVIIDPPLSSLKAGKEAELNVTFRTLDGTGKLPNGHTVTYTSSSPTTVTVTKINDNKADIEALISGGQSTITVSVSDGTDVIATGYATILTT